MYAVKTTASTAIVTPTVTLSGASIVSAYTATEAASRFSNGLQVTMSGAATATVNGSSVATGSTVTVATLSGATTLGAHAYVIEVVSTTGHTASLTVAYQVNADTPADTAAPSFVSSAPTNAATAVSVSSGNASLVYDEILVLNDAAMVLVRKASDLSDVSSGTSSVTTNSLAVPYGTLEYSTSYRITVLSGALQDAAGNVVTGDREVYFTTQSASAPDITGLSVGTVTNSSAVITYATDVVPTVKEYRISMLAYSGTWATLATSPATVSGLAANTTYYYQVRFAVNGQTVNSVPMSFKTAASNSGIAITNIARIPHGDPVVSGDYTNGYHFRFAVTANSFSQTGASFKLADWSNGIGTLAAATNTRMVVSQDGVADYATGSGSAVDVTNSYGSSVSVNGMDADASTGGRQFFIDVFYKIPAGAGGSYSTSYGILTQ